MSTDKKNNNPYGQLLDKYSDLNHVDWRTREEREKEAKEKYGNLLEYAKPDLSIYQYMVDINEASRRERKREEEEQKKSYIMRRERIEREIRKEREHRESINNFARSILAKAESKREAEQKAAEEKRMEEEHKQNLLNAIQRTIDISDEITETIEQHQKMMKYYDEKRNEHEEQMKWFESQKNFKKE